MSWLFSQVLVEEYSQGISSDGEPSALSNTSHIPQAYSSPDKMTAFCRLSRFGMTFAPLTETRGAELLMSFQADFRAKTSAQLEKVLALGGGAAASGKKWHELLAKFDPVTSSWKTAQCSLLEELEQSLEIWPRWGSMRNGVCYRQPMLAHHISEKESGYWPTPKSNDAEKRGNFDIQNPRNGLPAAVKRSVFPTPCASEARQGLQIRRNGKKGTQQSLTTMILLEARKTYATPTAACANGGHQRGKNKQGGDDLRQQIGGQLNPTWVEWLMGWPLGWTDLKPLETDKFREWQQQHGSCLID